MNPYDPRSGLGRPSMEFRSVRSLDERVRIIKDLVKKGIRNPLIRQESVWLVSGCPDRDEGCEIARIFWYVKANVRYTQDIYGIDTYQAPQRTIQFKGGDCDDQASLLCSMLGAIGFQTGFRVVSTTGKAWEHIYALVGVPKKAPEKVLPLDTTVPSSYPGWEPPAYQIRAKRDFYPIALL